MIKLVLIKAIQILRSLLSFFIFHALIFNKCYAKGRILANEVHL
jgi:hypothetical protein